MIDPKILEFHLRTLTPYFHRWIDLKKVPQTLLLVGPRTTAKRELAHSIAQRLLCQNRTACGQCSSCLKAQKGSWVDFTEILPEESDSGKLGNIKLEQLDVIKRSLGHGAMEGAYRFFVINDAQQLTLQAANSLLKILEEPPRSWIFVLTAPDSTLILPTLLSRSQVIRLKALPKELESLTKGPESEDLQKVKAQIVAFVKNPSAGLSDVLDWASESTQQLEITMDLLEQSILKLLQIGAAECRRDFLYAQSELIAETRKVLHAPLNRKIIAQNILLPWLDSSK